MPRPLAMFSDIDGLVGVVTSYLREQEMVSAGDRYVMVFGAPIGARNPTNSIRVVEVG